MLVIVTAMNSFVRIHADHITLVLVIDTTKAF